MRLLYMILGAMVLMSILSQCDREDMLEQEMYECGTNQQIQDKLGVEWTLLPPPKRLGIREIK